MGFLTILLMNKLNVWLKMLTNKINTVLFTNVPVNETIDIIIDNIYNNLSLPPLKINPNIYIYIYIYIYKAFEILLAGSTQSSKNFIRMIKVIILVAWRSVKNRNETCLFKYRKRKTDSF